MSPSTRRAMSWEPPYYIFQMVGDHFELVKKAEME